MYFLIKEVPQAVCKIGEARCKPNEGLKKFQHSPFDNTWVWECNNGMRSNRDSINILDKETKGHGADTTP